jgi:hypothetical protein
VAVAVAVGEGDGVGVALGVGVGRAAAHRGRVIVFASSVTAELRASRRPSITAPVVAVMLSRASTVPTR